MKVVTVPADQKFLSDLLMDIEEGGLILKTHNGQQFVLLSLKIGKALTLETAMILEKK
ncbi:MAG: hypothetical protein R2911_37695 [Caldilineaceae bacterium]